MYCVGGFNLFLTAFRTGVTPRPQQVLFVNSASEAVLYDNFSAICLVEYNGGVFENGWRHGNGFQKDTLTKDQNDNF